MRIDTHPKRLEMTPWKAITLAYPAAQTIQTSRVRPMIHHTKQNHRPPLMAAQVARPQICVFQAGLPQSRCSLPARRLAAVYDYLMNAGFRSSANLQLHASACRWNTLSQAPNVPNSIRAQTHKLSFRCLAMHVLWTLRCRK
jgi:hypothetical protein